jgi:hypothetical protein
LREQPIANFRRPSDDELPGLVDTLADAIGERAELPSWQRRLAIGDGNEVLLLCDVPLTWISTGDTAHDTAPEPGPPLDAWLAFAQSAFPLNAGLELLNSSESPEIELSRRRAILAKRDAIRAGVAAKKAAEEEAERKARAEAEERTKVWREGEWNKLSVEQRLLISVSLKVEGRDPILAADLREIAALRGGYAPLPKTQWWLPLDQRTDK